ncbi:MAG: c-type cytochrome [Bacteroidales bacterium]
MFRKNSNLKITITLLIITLFYSQLNAQRWDVPADKKAKNSFIKFDNVTAKEGEAIFTKNCQSCHGNPGKGNMLQTLKPLPPDLATALTQELTDGELFYILNTGRLVMPSFKNVLSENERWKLIAYIRSFNNKYVQVLSKIDPTKNKLVKIYVDFDSVTNKISVKVNANELTGVIPLKDAEVNLFANRYFGKLQIDKTLHTDANGMAVFNFPVDLPGDKSGNLDLVVNVNDEVYGEVDSQNKLKIGVPTDKPGLNEKRAIWNVLSKAPLWIILTFTSIILIVGSFLLYIVYNLFRLKKLADN